VISKVMSARIAMMQIRMRRMNHYTPIMDQDRMLRPEDIAVESVKIGQYISEM